MHDASLTRAALDARRGAPQTLAEALAASRADTLATFAAYEQALPGLQVPLRAELNPPLWELGHIGWFQEFWIARNPECARGERADPDIERRAPRRAGADALYNSSRVPHDSRWQLPLPAAAATRDDLARQLDETLALLRRAGPGDDALYFYRLALLHEDMHHEAALYMARGLGLAIDDARWRAPALPQPAAPLAFGEREWRLGSEPGAGFAFDNELPGLKVALRPFVIDAQAVRWAEFLPFVEAGGYDEARWWSEEGARWRAAQPAGGPRYLRRSGHAWQQWRDGRWQALDPREAACHLTWHEAEAWCRWAGRRLPTEAEWECAACSMPQAFRWGDVWEWSASPFAPFAGFEPHPYRDYSAPWFDGRPVLKGASHCTQPRMRHPRYRNFFPATRNDVPAGFRSCAA
ncbi:MAG TPA: selenoneine synthase SenA [Rubrivivax sp.]|nr:selenoneine synthase SenA [Rubrivivax sp.]